LGKVSSFGINAMGQCCGTDSRSESDEQYSRTDRRPGSSTHSSTYDPKSMPKQHIGFEEGTPSPPLPPPLVRNYACSRLWSDYRSRHYD